MPGTALAGWAYDGPFDDLEAAQHPGGFYALREHLSGATENAVAAHRMAPARALIDCLMTSADAFVAGAPQHDDMTLIVVRMI